MTRGLNIYLEYFIDINISSGRDYTRSQQKKLIIWKPKITSLIKNHSDKQVCEACVSVNQRKRASLDATSFNFKQFAESAPTIPPLL